MTSEHIGAVEQMYRDLADGRIEPATIPADSVPSVARMIVGIADQRRALAAEIERHTARIAELEDALRIVADLLTLYQAGRGHVQAALDRANTALRSSTDGK